METRQEVKYLISVPEAQAIRINLSALASPDPYADPDGWYRVHSLYFDDPWDTALQNAMAGVGRQEKYRLRYYQEKPEWVMLERKTKDGLLRGKEREMLTPEETASLKRGDMDWMKTDERELLRRFYGAWRTRMLRIRSAVSYDRMAYTFGPGEVRVTMDRRIRVGRANGLESLPVLVPPREEPGIVLEIKWGEYLPAAIRRAVTLKGKWPSAYSKYVASRSWE